MRSGGEGPCDDNTSLEAAVAEESVIVISDDEADVSLGLGNSVLLIEDAGENSFVKEKKTVEVLDEELAITFSRKAHVMPHARYDCSMHPFTRVEQETQLPLDQNASFCDECYCYLCDKPASECTKWTSQGHCHCNAHNKSKHWKEQRDAALVGVLTMFKLDLTEIDTELKEGGNKLQRLISELSSAYHKYLEGTLMMRDSVQRCVCSCHRDKTVKCNSCAMNHVPVTFHDYSEVHRLVTGYLNHIEEDGPKAAAVILLGTARELVFHKALPNPFTLKNQIANMKESSVSLMSRIVATLQRLLVLVDYPNTLYDKFISFFQCLPLPSHFYSFITSMKVMRWDNCLLTSVLAGQNLTGIRTNKGKKECLWEALPVVQSRVKRLEDNKSYRQLVRYLNAVQCSDLTSLNTMKQKLCLYMCKYGDFNSAANTLLQTKGMQGSIAKFFNSSLFELHLAMLRTKSCPPGNELKWSEVYEPQNGVSLKKGLLIRIALRVLLCNDHLFHESKCWSALVRIWCTHETLSNEGRLQPLFVIEPDKVLQQTVMTMSCTILDELQRQTNVHLPQPFHKAYGSSAEMILIIQAIIRYLMGTNPPLKGMLELVVAFGVNHWAVSLLIEGISLMTELLFQFVSSINRELYEDEQRIVGLFISRGPNYVAHLVPVFLLHQREGVRIVGFHLIDIVLKNLNRLPWSVSLGNSLKMKVLPVIRNYMFSPMENKKLMSNIGRLTSSS